VQPHDRRRFGPSRWRFTFLQHGVTKDNLARWLNGKIIDLFVTTSLDEYDSIVGDDTSYVFTSKEVALTGMPRHDALVALRTTTTRAERRLILIMPTWRKSIIGEVTGAGNARYGRAVGFVLTEYAIQISGLLRAVCGADPVGGGDFEVVFVPHPNMVPYLPDFDLPAGVRIARYADSDIQLLLSQAALLITDYSSIAFDAALIDVPIVYFQFDAEKFFDGDHAYTRGYFSYQKDGFGPVCSTIVEVTAALPDMLDPDSPAHGIYLARRAATFPTPDGNNSRRVYDAMMRLNQSEPKSVAQTGSEKEPERELVLRADYQS
jgi:CDP-glycerol glycerophosphotransferase (TagB/SpsB family)